MFISCLDQGCPAARRELHASSGFNAGQVEDAKKLLAAWVYAWTQFDGLPELFDMAASERHPLQKVHHSQPPSISVLVCLLIAVFSCSEQTHGACCLIMVRLWHLQLSCCLVCPMLSFTVVAGSCKIRSLHACEFHITCLLQSGASASSGCRPQKD